MADNLSSRRFAIPVVTAMVLVGSMLSFGMEPLVGRLVVPYYGGAVHVWTTAMMTFQGLLLVGYAYAHLLAPRLGAAHLLVLALPFLQWPLGFSSPVAPEAPIATLVASLLSSIALPFAALTTTAVVAQTWWANSSLSRDSEPWWLYGASNLGSLVALIGYPLLVEPFVGLTTQKLWWSGLYVVYLLLAGAAWLALRPQRPVEAASRAVRATDRSLVGIWIALAATPSMLLLALTNQAAHEVGSFPLVWVVPLGLYLGSFIVAFRSREGASVRLARSWVVLVAFQIVAFAAFRGQASLTVLFVTLIPFTLLCVACHRLLYELRPDVRELTSFYLWVAFGGWIGGTVVTLGAPTLLPGLYEPFLACAAVAVAAAMASERVSDERWRAWRDDRRLRTRYALYGLALLSVGLVDRSAILHGEVLEWCRNFYGTYRIEDVASSETTPAFRRMVHGGTVHGAELLEGEPGRSEAYFFPGSPVSDVFAARAGGPARVAVIGLGAGSMASMVDADDSLVYYEIDRDTEVLARRWFSFLGGAAVPVRVHVGDARLALQTENATSAPVFDLLMIDAFSGDGIPLHLATREAWQIYLDRVAKDGILAMHVSNRYYDLRPVLARHGADTQLYGVTASGFSASGADRPKYPECEFASEVVAFSRNREKLQPLIDKGWRPLEEVAAPSRRAWTDDLASVLTALR